MNVNLTFVLVIRSDGEHRVLDVLVLVHLRLVQVLVVVRGVVVLVRDADADEFGHWNFKHKFYSFMRRR